MNVGRTSALAGLVLLAALLTTPLTALAQVPSSIGSYVSAGAATGVHTIAGTSAFPNFENGAVNNYYPLAEVEQDASPSSAAQASYSDSGPLGATAGSQYNQSCSAGNPPPPSGACSNPNNSVPYANSNYPGGPASAHVDSCGGQSDCPAARADSSAAELQADASGFYSGGGTQPFAGATGMSETVVSDNGVLTVTTHSEVDSFAVGTLKISKVVVDTIATATNSSATADAHVVVGSITVNGQPVTLGDNGLTVQQTSAPCPSAPPTPAGPVPGAPPLPSPAPVPAPAGGSGGSGGAGGILPSPSTPALPGDSASCVPSTNLTYIQVFAVAPQRSVSGTHGVADASGLHVVVTHPTPGAGVPQQSVEYILGEGHADAQTGTGGAGGAFGLGDFGGFGAMTGDFGFNGPSADNGAGAGAGNPAAAVAQALFSNRWWPLVLLFLTFEALLFGSAAAWVWARNTPAEEVAEEVLSP